MQNINLEDILKIIEQFETSSIESLRYKTGDEEIELSKNKNGSVVHSNIQNMNYDEVKELLKKMEDHKENTNNSSAETKTTETKENSGEQVVKEEVNNLFTVTSPIIGTFYKSPAPGKPPYIRRGAQVKNGDVLCIIEAMKVMNKIECDVNGEVVEEVAEDGQAVEYGSELYKIKLD